MSISINDYIYFFTYMWGYITNGEFSKNVKHCFSGFGWKSKWIFLLNPHIISVSQCSACMPLHLTCSIHFPWKSNIPNLLPVAYLHFLIQALCTVCPVAVSDHTHFVSTLDGLVCCKVDMSSCVGSKTRTKLWPHLWQHNRLTPQSFF